MGIRDFMVVLNNPTTDPNCISFSNGVCQSCRNGLIVVNGTCNGCFSGFYLSTTFNNVNNSTLECIPCPQTCIECSLNTGNNTNNSQSTSVTCSACR